MIKLSKHIYIHYLTICLFVSAYITRTLEITVLMYSVMFLHEIAHTLSAKIMGLKVSKIIFYPFGVSLKLNSVVLLSFSEEIILYMSGPLINGILALIMTLMSKYNLLYFNNLALFVLNILPIIPLDGGRVLEAVISKRSGRKRAKKVMKIISIMQYCMILFLLLKFNLLNVNTITFSAFLLGSIIFEKEKYSVDFIKELSFAKTKKEGKGELFFVYETTPERKIAKEFNPSKRALVAVIDNDENIISLKTDAEVIKSLLKE